MRHKLAAQIRGNQINVVFVEVKIHTKHPHRIFNPAISAEIPLTWSQQKGEYFGFEAENHHRQHACHDKYANKHLSEDFEMSSESEHVVVFCHYFCSGVSVFLG